ncbi:unnamed protein product [Macrosiphum euphorbiae]|nr:unnamed protein product [Macrosiphum euphorbiae]
MLVNLCEKKIIEKSEEPSEWQNNLVLIEKPDKSLRMCLDPKDLNKCIIRERVEIPTLEEVRNKLMNKSFFTIVDLKDGFYQCELKAESKQYCAFSTPFGTYQFNRLPFGIACAPELFQQLTNKYFGNINNVCVYIDDILISGATKEEHDEALEKVMRTARQLNIKFNKTKFQFQKNQIKYLGLNFSQKGVEPDKERVRVITELKSPTNIKELQSILGMINYLRAFIPNMSEIVGPMRELLRKDSMWVWSKECEAAFNSLKDILAQVPTLANYDYRDSFEIQSNASQKAIGCCLFQKGRPVYYASRCLSSTEQDYAQIEKEMLAIKFSCEKFHRLIYGQKIIKVQTDHQPLISIMKKDIHRIPNNRLRRMRVYLLGYNLDVQYCPGKYMYVADLLSRNYTTHTEKTDKTLNDIVHTIEDIRIEFNNNKENEFKKATSEDIVLSKILQYLKKGWPAKIEDWGEIRHFHKIRSELVCEKDLIYYGCCLVVPQIMRKYIVNKLHETHLGTTKTIKKSKQIFFWPGMVSDITNCVSQCETCLKFSKNKIKEPLKSHSIPDYPFQKIGIDIAEINGCNYLVAMDYYSRWLEVLKLKNKTSESVIEVLKIVFSRLGVPREIVADNNPCGSQQFKDFSKKWQFTIILSSPNYPKSNGLAEKAVGIAKDMIKKATYENKDLKLFLLNYRNTPVAGLKYSPAQLMMSRELRTPSNCLNQNIFKPRVVNCSVENQLNKIKQKQWYDKNAGSEEKVFNKGEKVVIYDKFRKEWNTAEVMSKTKWPRSYLVKDGKGKILRRNTHFIKPVEQSIVEKTTKYDDIEEGEKEENTELKQKNESKENKSEQKKEKEPNLEVKQKSENTTVNKKEYYTTRVGRQIVPPKRYNNL